ncbi:LutC/YkgG family protein [Paenibacillus gansuensis]|uniref:Lactate utilization protein C n=1 Tax=Paenibacillus gansuensis TaxID=306542 RepID=A0ABW5PBX9_9BACL
MVDTHKDWLEELERKSRLKQEAFMNGIAGKLGRPRIAAAPAHPFRGAPAFWGEFDWQEEERISAFEANFRSAGGHVERLPDMERASAFIAGKAMETGARRIMRQDQPELALLQLEQALPGAEIKVWNSSTTDGEDNPSYWKTRAAEADFGVVMADYAAAYTGSVTVLSAAGKGRSVSLLPTVLFVILPVERLVTRLGEVLVNFDRMGGEGLPAGIHFISGPSRSADIENDLTIGVHGPGIVYTLIVGA